jgi:putative ABC transport system permease protein
MIRHLFKMVWNRRRANAFIVAELLISFLALCVLLTTCCVFLHRWSQPLGYQWENVWRLQVSAPGIEPIDDDGEAALWAAADQLVRSLQAMEEITASTPLSVNVPFSASYRGSRRTIDGTQHRVRLSEVSPEAKEVLGMRLLAGRWLREEDRNLSWEAVVITRDYATLRFGDEDPIGQALVVRDPEDTQEDYRERRVVGVVERWRHGGELDAAAPADFSLVPWGPGNAPPRDFLLRLREGVPAAFEEELMRTVRRAAPGLSFNVTSLAQLRESRLRKAITPLVVGGAIMVALGVMVGLGLVGVLWQSVTRRTEEIGLRRALGASAWGIRWQVLGELLALVTVATGIGSLLFLQFPLLGIDAGILFGVGAGIPLGVYLAALGLALVTVYSFVLVCGLYPSWLATRVRPAEALQYE